MLIQNSDELKTKLVEISQMIGEAALDGSVTGVLVLSQAATGALQVSYAGVPLAGALGMLELGKIMVLNQAFGPGGLK